MFEDSSNDSFEIPETQAFPPIDHLNDELDSEGYVAMPDEGIEANNCSQSQALLDGVDLQRKSSTRQNFDDSDGDVDIDMEMSNLQWDESTKENGNNKSASVTPDLDFNALSKTVARVIEDTLWSPQQSKVSRCLFHENKNKNRIVLSVATSCHSISLNVVPVFVLRSPKCAFIM